MHGAAVEEGARHGRRRVRAVAAEPELVVGLLVAAGVDRRAAAKALGEDQHVRHALGAKARGRGESRRPASDHKHVARARFRFAAGDETGFPAIVFQFH